MATIAGKIIRQTVKGKIVRTINGGKPEYKLYDHKNRFIQNIKTPFRVADYL